MRVRSSQRGVVTAVVDAPVGSALLSPHVELANGDAVHTLVVSRERCGHCVRPRVCPALRRSWTAMTSDDISAGQSPNQTTGAIRQRARQQRNNQRRIKARPCRTAPALGRSHLSESNAPARERSWKWSPADPQFDTHAATLVPKSVSLATCPADSSIRRVAHRHTFNAALAYRTDCSRG